MVSLVQRFAPALLCVLGLFTCHPLARAAEKYDPRAALTETRDPLDVTVDDAPRKRAIPLRVYRPATDDPVPVLLFSHGLGGSRSGCAYLGEHWAARGYLVVVLQHPGSDTSVWQNRPVAERRAALEKAASGENFLLRVQDVSAVLDQLTEWNSARENPLGQPLNLDRIGMSGHSFGAITTQAVSGQALARRGAALTDRRIKAALALSPSPPRMGDAKTAFQNVKLPWLLMTGTNDDSPIGNVTPDSRRQVYPALPAGGKYELVLDGAEHSAFTDRALPGDKQQRNPNHHPAILAISTAFWDAYLHENAAARNWLDGDGPPSVLEVDDLWQHK